MLAPLDALGLGVLLDYFIPLFHVADFPLCLSPKNFQGTIQGGLDIRRALEEFLCHFI
jgi:hypothetical protein